eukprot:g1635.t1
MHAQNNNVRNHNRLFDSQNNANGGYHIGDNCDGICHRLNDDSDNGGQALTNSPNMGEGKGVMEFYAGSVLRVEYAMEHGCGSPGTDCQVILQYMCESEDQGGNTQHLRDGNSTDRIPYGSDAPQYGRHEPFEYYSECYQRERNKGLFTADQSFSPNDPARQRACATRQDNNGCDGLQVPSNGRRRGGNNGNRYGYECPEERDYYPYWHPTPWRDIAVLTDDTSQCAFYQAESENVKRRGSCSVPAHNHRESCEGAGGVWEPASSKFAWHSGDMAPPVDRCVLRLRYNISSPETGGWAATAADNSKTLGSNPTKDYVQGGCSYDARPPSDAQHFAMALGAWAPAKLPVVGASQRGPAEAAALRQDCADVGLQLCSLFQLHDASKHGYVYATPAYYATGPHDADRTGVKYAPAPYEAGQSRYSALARRRRRRAGAMFDDGAVPEIAEVRAVGDPSSVLCGGDDCFYGRVKVAKAGTGARHGLCCSNASRPELAFVSRDRALGECDANPLCDAVLRLDDGRWALRRRTSDVSALAPVSKPAFSATGVADDQPTLLQRHACSGPLRLNMDTSQIGGRTFQDRTHTFRIKPRPDLPAGATIHNLNVRGRRGNDQQVFPALQYGFTPRELTVAEGDYVHFQWAGSDANPRNNAGNGAVGTDRSNLVQISTPASNVPTAVGPHEPTHHGPQGSVSAGSMFAHGADVHALALAGLRWEQCAHDPSLDTQEPGACANLNRAPAYFNHPPVKMTRPGTFHFMSTRNNAFSNREQKGWITVVAKRGADGRGSGLSAALPAANATAQPGGYSGGSVVAAAVGSFAAANCDKARTCAAVKLPRKKGGAGKPGNSRNWGAGVSEVPVY